MIDGGLTSWFGNEFRDHKIASHELPVTIADSFPPQWEMTEDESTAICLICSRRAGKTDGLQLLAAKKSQQTDGYRILYIHHTREVGKQQFYEPLRELLKRKGIPEIDHDETALTLRYGRNAFVMVVGCNNIDEVKKKLGFKWDLIVIDECQEFKDGILVRLVDKTILPTLIDKGGRLILSGTPSEVEAGVWYNAIVSSLAGNQHKGEGFKKHSWTLLENPHIDRANVAKAMGIRGFKIDFEHPERNDILIQREIFGMQVVDPRNLTYCYRSGIAFNDWPLEGVPSLDSEAWRYAMGIDIGGGNEGNDKDAVVVLGWMVNDPEHRLWERESWEGELLDSEEFCQRVLETYARWRPMLAVCGDTGGAGASKDLKWLAKRMNGLEMTPKPTSVDLSTRLLNDEFRSGRFKVNPLGLIARDAKVCTRANTYHSDIMAACRYAHHGVFNFLAKAEPKKPNPDDPMEIRKRRRAKWAEEDRQNNNPWAADGGWQT